jgi:hypothetical protein
MTINRHNKEPVPSTLADVQKEMAKPRIARSTRLAEHDRDHARIVEPATVTTLGLVEEITPPAQAGQREKAQIATGVADQTYRGLRIENTLTDAHGDNVKLKKGAHVEITVALALNSSSHRGVSSNARTMQSPGQPYDVMAERQVSQRAYQYWEWRGRPFGSPQTDWYRAVADLKREGQWRGWARLS